MKIVLAAKVAHIIDAYNVVINAGKLDGVTEGNRFLIYAIGGDIRDPATGGSLGRLELVRGEGTVVHVQDRMATVRTDRVKMRERVEEPRSGPFAGYAFPGKPVARSREEVRIPFESPQVG